MIYNIVGDLLKQDKVDIICHQTNCKGVMGAGIAFQIKRTYPEVFKKYKEFCDEYENILLGRTLFVNCNDGKVVANLFGQDGYGEDSARQIMWHLKRRLLRWQKPQPNIKRV